MDSRTERSFEADLVFLEHPRVYGLCMGLNDYKGELKPLARAVEDAKELHDKLCSLPQSHSVLSSNPRNPSDMKKYLRRSLKQLEQACPELLIFFYAGHGLYEPVSHDQMLVPTDVEEVRGLSYRQIHDEMLSLKEVFKVFRDFERDISMFHPRVLVVIDACRDKIEGVKEGVPQDPEVTALPEHSTLLLTCGKGKTAGDESILFQSLLDPDLGMFACNRPLDYVLLSSTRICEGKQPCVFMQIQAIPDGFCLVSDGEPWRDIKSSTAGLHQAAKDLASSTPIHIDTSKADTYVLAYSPEDAKSFRDRTIKALKYFLGEQRADSPRWRVCSIVLMYFLRYEDTRFSTRRLLGNFLTKVNKNLVGPELVELVLEYIVRNKISSPSFDAWKANQTARSISDDKLLIAILDYTISKEIRKVITDPDELDEALEIWSKVVDRCFDSTVSWEDAMDKIEEHLREEIMPGDGQYPSFYFYVLEQAVEVGSYVMMLKMTKLSSVFLHYCLLEYYHSKQGKHRHELEGWRTWISSAGWVVRSDGYRADWMECEEHWSKELRDGFRRLEECERPGGFRSFEAFLQEGRGMIETIDYPLRHAQVRARSEEGCRLVTRLLLWLLLI